MHIERIDLNLLVLFATIYSEGGITKAAEKLHITQPAVSHALAKLRILFDDALFIRRGHTMHPTPKARSLFTKLQPTLRDLQITLNDNAIFNPEEAEKCFTIGLLDQFESTILSELTRRIMLASSRLSLSSVRVNRQDIEPQLRSGELDAAIDILLPSSREVRHRRLNQGRLVVVARQNHPLLANKQKLSLQAYLKLDHIQVSSRRSGSGFEDIELHRQGHQRRIRARCQNAYAAFTIVKSSDLVLTTTENYVASLNTNFNHLVIPFPIHTPDLDTYLYWHSNVDNDPANIWLRKQILATQHASHSNEQDD